MTSILDDSDINLLHKKFYVFDGNYKKCLEFCSAFGLMHQIRHPAIVTNSHLFSIGPISENMQESGNLADPWKSKRR